MSESEGLQKLTAYLSQTRRQAEAAIDALNEQIVELKKDNEVCMQVVETLEAERDHFKNLAEQLKQENTTKYRLQERDDWKSLIDSVQKDRSRLQEECNQLESKIEDCTAEIDYLKVELQTVREERDKLMLEQQQQPSLNGEENGRLITPSGSLRLSSTRSNSARMERMDSMESVDIDAINNYNVEATGTPTAVAAVMGRATDGGVGGISADDNENADAAPLSPFSTDGAARMNRSESDDRSIGGNDRFGSPEGSRSGLTPIGGSLRSVAKKLKFELRQAHKQMEFERSQAEADRQAHKLEIQRLQGEIRSNNSRSASSTVVTLSSDGSLIAEPRGGSIGGANITHANNNTGGAVIGFDSSRRRVSSMSHSSSSSSAAGWFNPFGLIGFLFPSNNSNSSSGGGNSGVLHSTIDNGGMIIMKV